MLSKKPADDRAQANMGNSDVPLCLHEEEEPGPVNYRQLERAVKRLAQLRLDYDNYYRFYMQENNTAESRKRYIEELERLDREFDKEIIE